MNRQVFLFLCCVFIGLTCFADGNAVNMAKQTVIAVFPASVDDQAGGGSGVVISPDGYAVTNFHVVQPCGPAMKCAMADGKVYDAVVVGLDPVGDIALIKLLGRDDFPYSKFADSNSVHIGDTAIVMGNPFLLAADYQPCVSQGIISGVHRYQFPSGQFLEYTDCIQTDAAVNPGNSGGPLFNSQGGIIGIVGRCSFEKRGRVNVGIGYAVSSNQVRYFLGDLKSGRIADHATLNAVVSMDKEDRVMFDDVLGTSDAYRSGLRYNDQLLRFAGEPTDTANTFKNLIGIFPPHWRLPVTIRGKEDGRFELFVRLSPAHSEAELVEMTQKMIEPPIVPPEFKKMMERMKKREEGKKNGRDDANPDDPLKGFKEIEVPGPDGKMVKMLQKEHFIPESVKPFYEKQRGYANFYFNKIEKERVLSKWRNGLTGSLVLTGKIKNRPETFSFQADEQGVRYELPTGSGFWDAYAAKKGEVQNPDPTFHFQSPRGSGGLFTALYLMNQLRVNKIDTKENSEEQQSDVRSPMSVVYTGTAPLDGQLNKLYDCLSAEWSGNNTRFYFDPVTGSLVLIEMSASALDFPCEIRFRDGDKISAFEVRYGRILFGEFETAETVKGLGQTTPAPPQEGNVNSALPISHSPLLTPNSPLQKVAKIYGAGNIPGLHGYQTGILVSEDGYILTTLTAALQSDPLNVVLDTGRKYEAQVVGADPMLELALLKIPATGLPFFDLKEAEPPPLIGDPVYAVSNPFNIASGNEHVSVQKGYIAAQTTLKARRGVFETPYKGEIYVLDITTNNPGACGGALISVSTGELLGILGKELRNSENNTWLNFAVPVSSFRTKIQELITAAGKGQRPQLLVPNAVKPEKELIPEDTVRVLQNWGILLVSPVARRTPPFIDSVRKNSTAEKNGLKSDDLIVMVNNRITPSLSAVEEQIYEAKSGETVVLTIERDLNLFDVKLVVGGE